MNIKTNTTRIIGIAMIIAAVFGATACNRSKSGDTAAAPLIATPETDFVFLDGYIRGYNGTDVTVVIPSQIQGQPVTGIWYNAFRDKQLFSVVIPDSVTAVLGSAFYGNPLNFITIGANVELGHLEMTEAGGQVKVGAFDNIDNSFNFAYDESGKQAGTYYLYNEVWFLGDTPLKTEREAYMEIYAGDEADYWAQYNAEQAAAADFEFSDGGITSNTGWTITAYNGTDKSIVIPSQIQGQPVIEIGYNSFQGKQLTDVTIPDSIVMIWDNAFDGNLLKSVAFPDSVKYINRDAFKKNPLTSITIGADVDLGLTPGLGVTGFAISQAFDNFYNDGGRQAGTYTLNNDAWNLTASPFTFENGTITGYTGTAAKVVIPPQIQGQAVTAIGDGAFMHKQLESVVIPDSVITIGDGAFYNNRLTSIIIPNSVTYIEVAAFWENPLVSITIGPNVELGHDATRAMSTAFTGNFDYNYNDNGKRADTYTSYDGGETWAVG